jgi:hypothetical protein
MQVMKTIFIIATLLVSQANNSNNNAGNSVCIVDAWHRQYMAGYSGRGTGTYVVSNVDSVKIGVVVTAAHVLEGMHGPVVVTFTDSSGKKTYSSECRVLERNEKLDVAILGITPPPDSLGIHPLPIADKYPEHGVNVNTVGYAGRKYRLSRACVTRSIIKLDGENVGDTVGCLGVSGNGFAEHGDSGGPVLLERDSRFLGILRGNRGGETWKDRHIIVTPIDKIRSVYPRFFKVKGN